MRAVASDRLGASNRQGAGRGAGGESGVGELKPALCVGGERVRHRDVHSEPQL